MDHIDRADRISRKTVSIISKSILVLGVISIALVPFPISAAPSCGGLSATIVGTGNSDVLRGTEANDVIAGRAGDDIIYGSGGNDIICGNGGNDTIYGGGGNDTVYGGAGKDLIYGNEGDDSLFGQNGKDTIDGGSGVNTCEGESVVNCGQGSQTTTSPPTDTSPPSVTITSPSNGSTVYGTTTISATATDNAGVMKIELYLDGTLIGSQASNTYNTSVDTKALQNGLHNISAKAFDAAGNIGSSSTSMTVNNVALNNSLPTVSIISPPSYSTVHGVIVVTVEATDDSYVKWVELYADNKFSAYLQYVGVPAHFGYDTKQLSDGPHNFMAIAVDSTNNSAQSSIILNVDNSNN